MKWLVKIIALAVVWGVIAWVLYKFSRISGDTLITIIIMGTFTFPFGIGASLGICKKSLRWLGKITGALVFFFGSSFVFLWLFPYEKVGFSEMPISIIVFTASYIAVLITLLFLTISERRTSQYNTG